MNESSKHLNQATAIQGWWKPEALIFVEWTHEFKSEIIVGFDGIYRYRLSESCD